MITGYKKELASKLMLAFIEKYNGFEVSKLIALSDSHFREVANAEVTNEIAAVLFRFRNSTEICYKFLSEMQKIAFLEDVKMEAGFVNPVKKTEKGYFQVKFSGLEIYENDTPY